MDDQLREMLQEVLDRSRRIETRVTRYITAQGFETGARKPICVNDTIEIPSLATSMVDCVAAIPDAWDRGEAVNVTYRGRLVGAVLKP